MANNYDRIKKYQKQLLILSRLRKMEIIVKSQVEAMTFHYDIETDGLYLQGLEEGREEGIEQGAELKEREFIKNLWSFQEFSLEKIALLSGTSLERVIEILSAHLQAEGLSEAVAAQTLEAYQAKFV